MEAIKNLIVIKIELEWEKRDKSSDIEQQLHFGNRK